MGLRRESLSSPHKGDELSKNLVFPGEGLRVLNLIVAHEKQTLA